MVHRVLLFLGIVLLGASLRLYGLNWDAGQHLHPDERFLTMVTTALSWPHTISQFLDTKNSTFNPHNNGYPFFVYGLFPVTITHIAADILNKNNYTNLTLVGRALSGLVDTGTILLVFLTIRLLRKKADGERDTSRTDIVSLIGAFIYATTVLPIQLSHFYAVDTYLTFFMWLAVYLLLLFVSHHKSVASQLVYSALIGISVGLAISSKISGILVLPAVGLGLLFSLNKHWIRTVFLFILVFGFTTFITVKFANPYLFADGSVLSLQPNPKIVTNYNELKGFDDPTSTFPPAIQWRYTTPYLFPLSSMLLYGFGLPLSFTVFASFLGIGLLLIHKTFLAIKAFFQTHTLSLSLDYKMLAIMYVFILSVFIYQGGLYTKNMRYFFAIYPAAIVLASLFIFKGIEHINNISVRYIVLGVILCSFLIWPISFMAIYQRPQVRVFATKWIYANIPAGKNIGYEHWDDPLPLNLSPSLTPDRYVFTELPLYNHDTKEKWQNMTEKLAKTDYIVLTSNRLWRSIPRVPSLYPIAGAYYKALFDGSLGFHIIGHMTSIPCFPSAALCLVPINDQNAEESFTVYDHPEVYVFEKGQLNTTLMQKWVDDPGIPAQ